MMHGKVLRAVLGCLVIAAWAAPDVAAAPPRPGRFAPPPPPKPTGQVVTGQWYYGAGSSIKGGGYKGMYFFVPGVPWPSDGLVPEIMAGPQKNYKEVAIYMEKLPPTPPSNVSGQWAQNPLEGNPQKWVYVPNVSAWPAYLKPPPYPTK